MHTPLGKFTRVNSRECGAASRTGNNVATGAGAELIALFLAAQRVYVDFAA
jgi:hypothetical protein